jgi:hypothetical protein
MALMRIRIRIRIKVIRIRNLGRNDKISVTTSPPAEDPFGINEIPVLGRRENGKSLQKKCMTLISETVPG